MLISLRVCYTPNTELLIFILFNISSWFFMTGSVTHFSRGFFFFFFGNHRRLEIHLGLNHDFWCPTSSVSKHDPDRHPGTTPLTKKFFAFTLWPSRSPSLPLSLRLSPFIPSLSASYPSLCRLRSLSLRDVEEAPQPVETSQTRLLISFSYSCEKSSILFCPCANEKVGPPGPSYDPTGVRLLLTFFSLLS